MSLSNCSNAYALSLTHTHTFTHTHRLNEIPIYTMNKRKKLLRSLLILIDCACLFMDMHDKGHRLWKGTNCFPSILFYFGLTHCTFLDSFLSSPYKLSTNKCDLHTIPFKLTSFSAHPTIWFLWEGNLNEEISTSPFGKTWDFPFFLKTNEKAIIASCCFTKNCSPLPEQKPWLLPFILSHSLASWLDVIWPTLRQTYLWVWGSECIFPLATVIVQLENTCWVCTMYQEWKDIEVNETIMLFA